MSSTEQTYSSEEHKARLFSRLDARAEERRSQQRASGSSEANERLVQLSSSKLTIERLIETLESDSLEQNDAIQRLEQATTELDNLKSTLSEASVHLNSFDTQTYDQQVQAFQEKIGQLRDKHQPKKKFSFASTKKRDAVQSSVRQKPVAVAMEQKQLVDTTQTGARVFSKRKDDSITIDPSETGELTDIVLQDMENCDINVFAAASALRVSGLRNCRVNCVAIEGSTFLDGCADSTFQLATRQIRIHNTTCCDFFIIVSSRPTIEDCSNVRFGQYAFRVAEQADKLAQAGLNVLSEAWKDVQDFNWLRSTPSPNWSLIPDQR